jgi:hypothetical protein
MTNVIGQSERIITGLRVFRNCISLSQEKRLFLGFYLEKQLFFLFNSDFPYPNPAAGTR